MGYMGCNGYVPCQVVKFELLNGNLLKCLSFFFAIFYCSQSICHQRTWKKDWMEPCPVTTIRSNIYNFRTVCPVTTIRSGNHNYITVCPVTIHNNLCIQPWPSSCWPAHRMGIYSNPLINGLIQHTFKGYFVFVEKFPVIP